MDPGWGPGLMIIPGNHHNDRRRKPRIPLSWTIHLTRQGDTRTIEAVTKNISSGGVYCVAQEPFVVGEIVRCVFPIPTFNPDWSDQHISLDYRARVVRVELAGGGQYGIALHVEDYRVLVNHSEVAIE
jgi:hypothetical protein